MARRDDQTALLARVPLFSACSKKELQALAKRAEERRVPAGTAIVREGEAGDAFYVILQGQAKAVNKQGKVVNRLLPGDFFGEIALLDGGPRTVSIVSETPLTMLQLTR